MDEAAALPTDEVPPDLSFGAWVKSERLKRKMTLTSLGKQAGITYVAVVKIENGQIKNPRPETRAALAMALKESVPQSVEAEILRNFEIPGLGEFQDFVPHDKDQWPRAAGIYVLYDISDRPIYVGQGNVVHSRLREHEQKFWYKRPIVDKASFIQVDDGELRMRIETILIKFLRSNAVINYVSRD